MKKLNLYLFIAFFTISGILASCTSESSSITTESDSVKVENKTDVVNKTDETKSENANTEKADIENAKFVCPNRCPEGKSDKAGECPSCGMELVENQTK